MAALEQLPAPHLTARRFGARRLPALTDDELFARTGVRIAFTGREGGASVGPYASLNLGGHVGDDPEAVATNRSLLLEALDAAGAELVVPSQVHGDEIVLVDDRSPAALEAARQRAAAGADALVVSQPDVAALLCFADCVPVVLVSPSGRFAVVHAGWRGMAAGIASKAARLLVDADARDGRAARASALNAYVGPHIRSECFETGPDVLERFAASFGPSCVVGGSHVDLSEALAVDLGGAGVERGRIVCADACTACAPDQYFSYRASGGTCGRHGAIAFRKAR